MIINVIYLRLFKIIRHCNAFQRLEVNLVAQLQH